MSEAHCYGVVVGFTQFTASELAANNSVEIDSLDFLKLTLQRTPIDSGNELEKANITKINMVYKLCVKIIGLLMVFYRSFCIR